MDGERKKGNELLAISHNANPVRRDGCSRPRSTCAGRPIDAAWAESRERNEKLTEIHQIKGTSETHRCCRPTTSSPTSRSCSSRSATRPAARRSWWAASRARP